MQVILNSKYLPCNDLQKTTTGICYCKNNVILYVKIKLYRPSLLPNNWPWFINLMTFKLESFSDEVIFTGFMRSQKIVNLTIVHCRWPLEVRLINVTSFQQDSKLGGQSNQLSSNLKIADLFQVLLPTGHSTINIYQLYNC